MRELKWNAAPLMHFDSALQDAENGILGDSEHNLIRGHFHIYQETKERWSEQTPSERVRLALSFLLHSSLLALQSSFRGGKKPCRNTGWWGFHLQPVMYVPKKQCFNRPTIKKSGMSEFVSSVSSIIADQSGDDASNQPVVYSSWWWLVRDIDIPPLGWKYVELTHLLLSTFTK